MRKGVVILGATGSIGRSALEVMAGLEAPPPFEALTAYRDVDRLVALAWKHRPRVAVIADPALGSALADALRGSGVEVAAGVDALADVAGDTGSDTVISAIVGAAGLLPTLAAVRAGKRVLIANKEPLVMAGGIVMAAARAAGAEILPVDSEHNAIFQCLPAGYCCGQPPEGVDRLILTASGGPFRTWSRAEMAQATPAQAVAHPNWDMGAKISVDSATMMNKGLEVIEAHWLFATPAEQIDIVVHPQSIVHSLVAYRDGSFLAQMGAPDMRIPIANALGHPDRLPSGAAPLDLVRAGTLHFEAADAERFPCLRLARAAIDGTDAAPTVLNAANEVAVEAFLAERLAFDAIAAVIEATLEGAGRLAVRDSADLDAVIGLDAWARSFASERIAGAEYTK
ncbi:1-deoxy-D-xylulose-5-phosphate reductoisomerase [Algiphilus sp.]|uniref:1-deoxy-D-xylulose-5-phosphate reductoisomerase n=1 Tax=Algiphilus sp. TaxID=1872431 RepID=UPI003B52B657